MVQEVYRPSSSRRRRTNRWASLDAFRLLAAQWARGPSISGMPGTSNPGAGFAPCPPLPKRAASMC